MTLPELSSQIVYARLAWGLVLAALFTWGLWRSGRAKPGQTMVLTLLTLGAMWLPGPASAAYWLGLAFQSPSGLLVALCAAGLVRCLRPAGTRTSPLLPAGLSIALALGGALLYADATGWLMIGLYGRGFSPSVAWPAGLALGLLGTAWVLGGTWRETGLALLAAAALFTFLRMPTGNVFDAVIDPFLWAWALCSVAGLLARAARARADTGLSSP